MNILMLPSIAGIPIAAFLETEASIVLFNKLGDVRTVLRLEKTFWHSVEIITIHASRIDY